MLSLWGVVVPRKNETGECNASLTVQAGRLSIRDVECEQEGYSQSED